MDAVTQTQLSKVRQANTTRGVLRFITAGSVDDGKSTLIGRLLFDSQAVLADQLSAVAASKHKRTVVQSNNASEDEVDLALLTDGLEAEREQGITIDIAYRYFATAKRKFIIADAPGHEQYTRNMVTGASTADAAIVLIDAMRVGMENGRAQLLTQTKRHSAIIQMLGLQHVIVAVNKMDIAGFSQTHYQAICQAYAELAAQLHLRNVQFVPVSALRGDNIVNASAAMPWYEGEPLVSLLENLPLLPQHNVASGVAAGEDNHANRSALRFPVQLVARQDGSAADDFRGYMGRVEAGSLHVGQTVRIEPSGRSATVAEIFSARAPKLAIEQAVAGENITVRLSEDMDVSRGDMLVMGGGEYATNANHEIQPRQKLRAEVCWFDETPLNLARKYLLKHTTNTVGARITQIEQVLDVHTLQGQATPVEPVKGVEQTSAQNDGTSASPSFKMNDIGTLHLSLQKPLLLDAYASNHATGAFILIDEATHHTVAAGMVLAG